MCACTGMHVLYLYIHNTLSKPHMHAHPYTHICTHMGTHTKLSQKLHAGKVGDANNNRIFRTL